MLLTLMDEFININRYSQFRNFHYHANTLRQCIDDSKITEPKQIEIITEFISQKTSNKIGLIFVYNLFIGFLTTKGYPVGTMYKRDPQINIY